MEAGERREAQREPLSVAVIGAGAAGLVATHELRKEGHHVVVFEQQSSGVGGVWCYSEQVDVGSTLVHSSMYLSLRTNLPREIMGFLDFPFLPKHHDCSRSDVRRCPHHAEVLSYLEEFALHFSILPSIRFGRRVTHVSADGQSMPSQADDHMQWSVVSEAERDSLDVTTDLFDAIVVCNGHLSQPKLASIPGCGSDWKFIKWIGHLKGDSNCRQGSSSSWKDMGFMC